ncbi:MAG: DNA internalization-related competence protein ComEC/Rec2 [Brevibacillus sp.]|nr:DNA internalization-related competence protein ComEC/Rec2 [Brevibacillus sp.]
MAGGNQHSFFLYSIWAAAGITTAAYLPVYLFLTAGGILVCAVLLLAAPFRKGAIWLCAALAAGGYYYLYDHWHTSALIQYAAEEASLELSGRIASLPQRDGDTVRFFFDVDTLRAGNAAQQLFPAEQVACRLKLEAETQLPIVGQWRSGDRVTMKADLVLPEGARNPHAFDYARYLRWQGVYVLAQSDFSRVLSRTDGGGLAAQFESWQMQLAERLDTLFTNQETAGFMKSLLLGLRQEVEPRLADSYADLGLIHVLAISGLHVTMVSTCFLWLLERMGVRRGSALTIAIAFIGVYVLLVGASPSAVRAGLMGGLGLWAIKRRKRLDVREVWGIALLLMLLVDPFQLWQIGFQLSFAVTLGLIVYVPLISHLPYPRMRWLRTAIAVTSAASLVSFPFLVYWFHQFSPLSLFLNLLVVPFLSAVVLPGGYIALLLSFLQESLGLLPAQLLHLLLQPLQRMLMWLSEQPVPFSHWPHPHGWWLVAYAVWLVAVPFAWSRGFQRSRDVVLYALTLALLLVAARQPFSGTDEVRITFLDVGQGDSIVVEVAKKTVYLIDGGGIVQFAKRESWREKKDPFEPGKDVVVPFLRSRGIEEIDRLVVTHGDQDHIGGLFAVAAHFPVAAALLNGTPPARGETELLDNLVRRHVPLFTGRPGMRWEDAPQVEWTWLWPDPTNLAGEERENDASVVLLLSAYGTNVLFTGDIEQTAEHQLVHNVGSPLARVDVLKVAHHGSNTSTTTAFLEQIKPEAAVISAGRGNRYGHPSPDVIQRLKASGAAVYRTDQQGAITLIIRPDGMEWQIQNK